MKEKLHFMQTENKAKHTQLSKADTLVALKREVLTRTRQVRDSLRADNLKLQQRCGLRGNTTLLRDFEEKIDTSECLQQRLEMLKRRHAELTLKCAGVKQKIEQSKAECQWHHMYTCIPFGKLFLSNVMFTWQRISFANYYSYKNILLLLLQKYKISGEKYWKIILVIKFVILAFKVYILLVVFFCDCHSASRWRYFLSLNLAANYSTVLCVQSRNLISPPEILASVNISAYLN